MSKVDLHLPARTVEVKGSCLQLKRSETEYAAQKIKFLALTGANDHPFYL